MDFKNTKRKEIENKLTLLGEKVKEEKSRLIMENLLSTNLWEGAKNLFIYIDFRNEVKTEEIIRVALKMDKRVFVPVITGKEMTFHHIDSLKGLKINKYGIKEPDIERETEVPTPDSIIILPGVGFTKEGERLGRGGGFYDRYLSKYREGTKVAIAFSEQIVDSLETDPWDKKADIVVTDKEIYRG